MEHRQGLAGQFHDSGDLSLLPGETRHAPWTVSALHLVEFPAHSMPDPASDNFVLCLIRKGSAKASFGFGQRRWDGELTPGMFAPVTPPHVEGEIRLEAPQQHLVLSISASAVTAILGTRGDDLGTIHESGFRDALLSQICLSLWEAAQDEPPRDRLFEEYALAALVVGLARRSRRITPEKHQARPLSAAQWRLIDSYIADEIGSNLSLPRLAGLAGMTQHAFLRAFKAQTGCAPHQYILRRRIEYVRQLLPDRRLSLADIALQAGFADQAHMTATFTRLTGTTPGKLKMLQ